jgi:hypothetical protein
MKTLSEVTRRADALFMKVSRVHDAARRLAEALDDLHVPYAIADALAANVHGHERTTAEQSADGYRVLPLRMLLELKIASGMTAPHRPQDLADAIELIRRNHLPLDFPIHVYVQDKYRELWSLGQLPERD